MRITSWVGGLVSVNDDEKKNVLFNQSIKNGTFKLVIVIIVNRHISAYTLIMIKANYM